ncbi:Highly reducing polyketide synthase gloL [Colletotrichum trifolii]|uniref:Highly reducing polyketide synthase gloL n=1 Tax=Colletotrichum trifolii TaxID=5466 RepID=A0A4V3HWG6_COLTR|nr:Highly reducing polyketide synthase gloL [Colletotrichum trifolii]
MGIFEDPGQRGHGVLPGQPFNDKPAYEPIAIIGMGMRPPGRVNNAQDYWDLLVNGLSGICRVPESRYNIDTWLGPGRENHVPTENGYFLDDLNLAHVDPSFWSFTKQEAELMDPRQRLFLEVAYEALQNSGAAKFRGTDVGVYVGTMGDDWSQIESHDEQNLDQVRPDVYGDYIIANRASYEFDLTGPSVVVRTACSASLVALHMACRDLQSGDCSSALVGGVNLILTPRDTAVMHQQGVLSVTASCKSFDADADGFARGEGVSAIHIKKLSDAVRDGDPIRAVIRSTCVSGNGRTPGLTTPNAKSHEKLMRRGHALAGITDLSKTAMVECHGTGTAIGDPLEVGAVANIWGEHGMYIGSVKPNIGHGEGASGLSSVIKMILALENSTIPPNINFKTPNPKIPWESAKLTVPTKALPWPRDKLERVSVNSFGIGGSNAHILLESAKCFGVPSSKFQEPSIICPPPFQLLAVSAAHSESLRSGLDGTEEYLVRTEAKLEDVACTLLRKEALPCRAFCVTDGSGPLQFSQITNADQAASSLVWVFTGQGAQWARMGKELLESNPMFQQRISHLDNVLAKLENPPPWTLRELLMAPKETSRLAEAEFSQPCLAAIQIALVDLLRFWGVRPHAVVGHSSGETAAAYASGAMTAEDAIRIAYHRGQITLVIKAAHNGSMAAVGIGRGQVERFLRPGVIVGCENSPQNVTLSGDAETLAEVMRDIGNAHPDVLVRGLRVECGYHSHHMKAAESDFASRLDGLFKPQKPVIPFYSSVTGNLNDDMSPSYWVRNVVSPVLFSTAVDSVINDFKSLTLVEIGPHSALAGPLRQIATVHNRNIPYIPTLVRDQDAFSCALKTAGELWAKGVDIDLSKVIPPGRILTDMPTYHWHYDQEYWRESRLSRAWRKREFGHHELLGTRVEDISDACPAWRCKLRVEDAPWLRDHVILGETVFPASGFLSMAGEALRQLSGLDDYTLRDVRLDTALVLDDAPVELVTVLHPSDVHSTRESTCYDLSVSSLKEGSSVWTKHVRGRCVAGFGLDRVPSHRLGGPWQDSTTLPRKVSASSFHQTWSRFGLHYGPRFRNLEGISADVHRADALATLPDKLSPHERKSYSVHPTLLDSGIHFAMISACSGLERNYKKLEVPTYIKEVYVGRPHKEMKLQAMTDFESHESRIVGVSEGQVVLQVMGLQVDVLHGGSTAADADPHAGAILDWKPDIDFMDTSKILSKRAPGAHIVNLDKLVLACIVETRWQPQFHPATQPHLVRLKDWLESIYRQAMAGECHGVFNASEIAAMSRDARRDLILQTFQACRGTSAEPAATGIVEICDPNFAILRGGEVAANEFSSEVVLQSFVEIMDDDVDLSLFLQLLGHKNPSQSILHIEAESQGAKPLARLLSTMSYTEYGDCSFGRYVCTGKSQEPPDTILALTDEAAAVSYSRLDVEEDVSQQGLKPESFDLVIWPHSITPTLASLKNLRKLLRPSGRLVIKAMNPASRILRYVYEQFPEYNSQPAGADDGISLQVQLDEAGFNGSAATTFAGEHSKITIATPFSDGWLTKRASIICRDRNHPLVTEAAGALLTRGLGLDYCGLGQDLPWGQPVVCLLDLESPFFHTITAKDWENLKKSVSSAQDEKVLWVTGASQIKCQNPDYSLALGVTRSLRRELSIDLVTLELESFDVDGWGAMAYILTTMDQRFIGGDVDPDFEYAFSQGVIQTCRFHRTKVSEQLKESSQDGSKQLEAKTSAGITTLRWEDASSTTITGDVVEIRVKEFGLNSGKISHMTNATSGKRHRNQNVAIIEGSGVVQRVGTDARKLRVGDRVAFFHKGAPSTSIAIQEALCVPVPETMTFEEAASIPQTYGTAFHGLLELGKLRKGQSVLIWTAGDGDAVGLAAIQLAKTMGVEIFCAVPELEQSNHVSSKFGFRRGEVLFGTAIAISREVFEMTRGRGVDVVFGCMSKESLQASWTGLAPLGTLIQQGCSSKEEIDVMLQRPEQGRTFCHLDIGELATHSPSECARLMEQGLVFHKLGLTKDLPITKIEASQVDEAIHHLQQQKSPGNVILTVPEDHTKLRALPVRTKTHLRPDRTYVFVGGLGGLGQAAARFLVERGARDLIFFSRSAEETAESHPGYFEELRAMGCNVQAVSGSVSDVDDVAKVVGLAASPIAGIMQAAMVLQDANFADMTFSQWEATVQPKVQGTWNLHHALKAQGEPLDFFLLFSSLSGLGGQIGQANYAAANAFLDAFVQFRHSQGLTCSVLDIGIMEDIGVLSREKVRLEALRATSQHCLHEQDLLDALELMIRRSHATSAESTHEVGYTNPSQVAIGVRSSSSTNRTGWRRDARAGFLEDGATATVDGDESASGETLKEFLQTCSSDPTRLDSQAAGIFLAKEIGIALQDFMMHHDGRIDISLPLQTDSLVTVELRNWIRQKTGVSLTVMELRTAPSVLAIGEAVANRLRS